MKFRKQGSNIRGMQRKVPSAQKRGGGGGQGGGGGGKRYEAGRSPKVFDHVGSNIWKDFIILL